MKYPIFNPVSVDLLPTDGLFTDRHIVGDVSEYLYSCNALTQSGIPISVPSWDMVIAFPPCTYLTNAGAR